MTPTPSPDPPTTIILQQGADGYWGTEDTYVYQYDPDKSYHEEGKLAVGSRQRYAALLRFDLTGVPRDALVTRAVLELYAFGWSGTDTILGTYYVTRTITMGQVTWKQAQKGNPWGRAGCKDTRTDRRTLLEAIAKSDGVRRWYDFDLTDATQAWVGGTWENNGVLLLTTYPTFEGTFLFASAQYGDVNLRPRLVVTYVPHAPTPTTTPFLIIGHITDDHVGRDTVCSGRLPAMARLISTRSQVLVDTGDCTENGTEVETLQYRDDMHGNMTIPWQVVPGNHDSPDTFARYIGPLEWAWDVGGYRLIGINSESINYTALDAALTDQKPCIVFGHFPLPDYSTVDQYELRQRFRTYRVLLYVAGHRHADSWTTDPTTGTQLLVGHWTCGGHYRLITLLGSTVGVDFY